MHVCKIDTIGTFQLRHIAAKQGNLHRFRGTALPVATEPTTRGQRPVSAPCHTPRKENSYSRVRGGRPDRATGERLANGEIWAQGGDEGGGGGPGRDDGGGRPWGGASGANGPSQSHSGATGRPVQGLQRARLEESTGFYHLSGGEGGRSS